MTCGTKGWKYQMFVEPGAAPYAFDTSSERYFPVSLGLASEQPIVEVPGTTGERDIYTAQVVGGNIATGGPAEIKIGTKDLDFWLPRILGGAQNVDDFPLADVIPEFGVMVDKGQQIFEYVETKVARATFAGSSGGVVGLTLDLLSKGEIESIQSAPVIDITGDPEYRPLRFASGVLTIDGIDILFDQFSLVIDNGIEALFYNNENAQCLDEGRRTITLSIPAAYTSITKDLYNRGFEGLACELLFSGGAGMETKFEIPGGMWAGRSPSMSGPDETPLVLEIVAYKVDTDTPVMTVTNASTPTP